MRTSRLITAIVLAVVGLIWIGQGIGLIGGSAMTGSSFWAVVGAILLVVSIGVVGWERRVRARAPR